MSRFGGLEVLTNDERLGFLGLAGSFLGPLWACLIF